MLLDAVNLTVDESALTGEAIPVRKVPAVGRRRGDDRRPPGGDATPWVFSGTLVVKGHGVALVLADGRRHGARPDRHGAALRSSRSARRCSARSTGWFGSSPSGSIGAAALVVLVLGLTRHDWLQGLLAGIGAAMAMLPEEIPVVLTVFLALGAWRMSQRSVLTRRPAVIETLGSATVDLRRQDRHADAQHDDRRTS